MFCIRFASSSVRLFNLNLVCCHCRCTDPDICKRQIAEDFEQEKPLWTLTCYGHCKGYMFIYIHGGLKSLIPLNCMLPNERKS